MVSKYGNKRVVVDGISFASKREADRWSGLRILERAGVIKDLERQVPFACMVNGIVVCTYIADFVYKYGDELVIVEDAKGFRTNLYKLKKKLVFALYGIEIKEV